MPRRAHNAPGGLVYHVLNRAVARSPLFVKAGDFQERTSCVLFSSLDMTTLPRISGVDLSFTGGKPDFRRNVEHIDSFDHLTWRLIEIQATRDGNVFIGVNLHDAVGNEFGIALADDLWALFYSDAQHSSAKFSLDTSRPGGFIQTMFEQWEELPKRYFIPLPKALAALRHWFSSGELSDSIVWEMQSLGGRAAEPD